MEIGSKLKNLRVQQMLTQEELADRSELTKGFISQVERDLTSPSVATLIDILEALGTSPEAFFKEDSDEQIVFKKDDYFVRKKEEGYKITWIVPNAQKNNIEPIIIDINSNSRTKTINPFEGEIMGYVLDGEIELNYDEKSQCVKKNETFYFRANKESFLENKGGKKAKVMYISSPPSF